MQLNVGGTISLPRSKLSGPKIDRTGVKVKSSGVGGGRTDRIV